LLKVSLLLIFLSLKLTLISGYFLNGYNKKYSFLDDITYLTRAVKATEENLSYVDFGAWITLAGSSHFLYYVHNAFSVSLFGPNYVSPIILNSLIWFLTVFLIYKNNIFDITEKENRYFSFFLLFSPIFLTWNSFINTKDFLVIFLDVSLILYLKKITLDNFRFQSLFMILVLVMALFFLRFYNAPIIIISYFASFFLFRWFHILKAFVKLRAKVFLPPLLGLFGVLIIYQNNLLMFYIDNAVNNFSVDLKNIARYILGPNPLNLDERYAFLFVAESFQKIFVLFALFFIFTRVRNISLMVIFSYLLIIFFTISLTQLPELVGPRHRLQIDLYIHLLSFLGLLAFFRRCR
jgi:hypothetical protein